MINEFERRAKRRLMGIASSMEQPRQTRLVYRNVTVEDLIFPLMVCFYGLILSVIIFVGELQSSLNLRRLRKRIMKLMEKRFRFV